MVSIALCDDESIFLEKYAELVEKFFQKNKIDNEIIKFKSGESLLFQVEDQPKRFQIYILDVMMDKLNGLETAIELKKFNEDAKIIFLTNTEDFVFSAFEAGPVTYLIKDKDDHKLEGILEKIVKKLNFNLTSDNFTYHTKNNYVSIPNSSIVYFEVFHRVISVHKADKTIYDFYFAFKELDKIIDKHRFVKIFRSYIVNMQYIKRIFNHQVELKNGIVLPVSRNLYEDVKQKFSSYLNSHL